MDIRLNYKEVLDVKENYKKNIKSTRYHYDEKILKEIITQHKEDYLNANLEYVYFISTLINSFYSTRMGNDRLFIVAEFISKYKGITTKDKVIEIIEDATQKPFEYKRTDSNTKEEIKKTFKASSFLSKYYAIHNRFLFHDGKYSEYVILDSAVEKCIKNIMDCAKGNHSKYSQTFCKNIEKYKKKDLKNYKYLDEIINIICEEINREKDGIYKVTLTDIDNYFWGIIKFNNPF